MRGRKPTPSHLKLVRGNPGHRPLNDAEPIVPALARVDVAEPPPVLGRRGAAEWRRVAPLLADAGLLTNLDLSLLGQYCQQFEIYLRASDEIAKADGLIGRNPSGRKVVAPLYVVMMKSFTAMLRAGEQLGLSPSARSRIRVDESKPRDDFEDYLRNAPK